MEGFVGIVGLGILALIILGIVKIFHSFGFIIGLGILALIICVIILSGLWYMVLCSLPYDDFEDKRRVPLAGRQQDLKSWVW